MTDYPDGYQRSLPGHTVELEASYALPWHDSTTLTIAGLGNSSYTLSFSDPDYIYFIDTVSIVPSNIIEFGAILYNNDVSYISGAGNGWVMFYPRENPAMFWIDGDSFKVWCYNYNAAEKDFVIHINGTKIKRPASFGRVPESTPSVVPLFGVVGSSAQCTDASTNTPTSWLWDFRDGDAESTLQNPVHTWIAAGTMLVRLTAANAYGSDIGAIDFGVEVVNPETLSGYVEVDPNSDISVSAVRATVDSIRRDAGAYLYRDCGASYFDDVDLCADICYTDGISSGAAVCLGLANGVGTFYNLAGVKLFAQVAYSSSTQFRLNFYCQSGTTTRDSDYATLNKNTVYRIRLERASAATSATLKIYSGTYFDTLVDTLTVSHADAATLFRYLYAVSSFANNSTPTVSFYVENVGIIDH